MQDAMNWLARDPDPRTREELQHLIDEGMHDELEDRFTQRLEFGTAGLKRQSRMRSKQNEPLGDTRNGNRPWPLLD